MRLFELRVTESFSKEVEVGSLATVLSGTGGADCSYRFEIGKRYFVHSVKTQDQLLFTNSCMSTGPVELSEVILQELRMKALGLRLPDLTGDVSQYLPGQTDDLEFPSTPNITIKLTPVAGGETLKAVTDSKGIYRFQNLSAGTYTFDLDLPRRLRTWGSSLEMESMTITVAKPTDDSSVCHVSFVVAASGVLEGKIVSPHRQQLDGLVSTYALNSDGGRGRLMNSRWTEDDGSFRIQDLSAGRYLITYKTKGRALIAIRSPIILAEAEHKQNIQIRVK